MTGKVQSSFTMAILALGCAASCGSDDGDGSGGFSSVCLHYTQIFCTKFTECYPELASYFGDPATCTERYA